MMADEAIAPSRHRSGDSAAHQPRVTGAPRARRWLLAVLVLGALTWVSCAHLEGQRARSAFLYQEISAYRYTQPRQEILEAAAAVVEDEGYEPREHLAADDTLTTEWKVFGETRRRYIVSLEDTSEGVKVRFNLWREDLSPQQWAPQSLARALDVAAELAERLASKRVAVAPPEPLPPPEPEPPADPPGEGAEPPPDRVPPVMDPAVPEPAGWGYALPAAALWTQILSLLGERGFTFESETEPPIGWAAATRWKSDAGDGTLRRSRYTVVLERTPGPTAEQYRVEITLGTEIAVGERYWQAAGSKRSADLEEKLLRRLEPDKAADITDAADAEGQRAYEAAKRMGYCSAGPVLGAG